MTEFNFEQARYNMIEQQIRPWEVLDPKVLEVMAMVPREAFVADADRALALADLELPIGFGERMMAPKLEGKLLQALDIQPGEKILEVGTGSGYLTACLAKLGGRVHSVEIHAELSAQAAARLKAQGIGNVELSVGDAADGWDTTAPYDAIAVTGSLPAPSEALERQLKVGGRLFVVIGGEPTMEAFLITRTGENSWNRRGLFDTVLAPLSGTAAQRFVF